MNMSPRLAELALRKRVLQQRSALLRRTLAQQVGVHVSPALGMADRVVASGRWLRQHPALLIGGAVALLVWRPTGLLRWAGRGMWLWQAWQRVQPMLAKPPAPPSNL